MRVPLTNGHVQETLDLFRLAVTSRSRQEKGQAPVVLVDGVSFIYIVVKDLYFVATSHTNCNAAMALCYLAQLRDVLVAYVGPTLNEKSIRGNFCLVYELLDETIDYGVPQMTSVDVLQLYIKSGDALPAAALLDPQNRLTEQITGKTDWRAQNIKYAANEIYIDVVENVNVLVAADGTVLKSDVTGEIKLRVYLSGMPECKLALNDRAMVASETGGQPGQHPGAAAIADISIEDWSFHRCVRLGKFDADRSIIFVPPDGVFELMKYRVSEQVNLPFIVDAVVTQESKLLLNFNLKVSCNFPPSRTATGVVIKMPVPPNTVKTHAFCSPGKAKYEPAESAIVWRVRKCTGGQELNINGWAETAMGTVAKTWSRPPVSLAFNVNMFTSSGMYVMYLRVVEASGYTPGKFVRYVTKAGAYQYRI